VYGSTEDNGECYLNVSPYEGLAEIGEAGGGFGLHLTLGDSGEEASEGGAEVAGGHIAAGNGARGPSRRRV